MSKNNLGRILRLGAAALTVAASVGLSALAQVQADGSGTTNRGVTNVLADPTNGKLNVGS